MKNKIVILDTETTDVTPEPWMIQLGYIVCDLEFNELKRENLFFDIGEKKIDIGAMAIHHITPKILEQKLSEDTRDNMTKKWLALTDFEDAYLVAHNSPFDKRALEANGIFTDEDQWIDTYKISYDMYTDDDMRHTLQYLRYFLGCEFSETIDAHDALSDVIVLKSVFELIYEKYMSKWTGGNPFEEFIEDTKIWIVLRTWTFGKHKGRTFADTYKTDFKYFVWLYQSKLNSGQINDPVFNTLKYYLEK